MGVIALALYTHGSHLELLRPDLGEDLGAGLTIAAGTYAGGWRIIRTLGQRIYKLAAGGRLRRPDRRRDRRSTPARTSAFPISTTHVVTGSVMGAGATRRFSAVRWGVAGNIVIAWLLTLPAAALVAAALYWPVHWIF